MTAQPEIVRKEPHDEVRTAYHEVGHVLLYLHYGLPIKYATILPTDDAWGHVMIDFEWTINPTQDEVEKYFCVLSAGFVSEGMKYGHDERLISGYQNDLKAIRIMLSNAYPNEDPTMMLDKFNPIIFQCGEYIETILKRFKIERTLLVEELVKRKTLTYNELVELQYLSIAKLRKDL